MIIEISIVALVLLKLVGVVDISWTLTVVLAAVLIVVEINSVVQRKRIEALVYKLAAAVDRKVDDLEFDIEHGEHQRRDREKHNQ
ncbi:hypothetical protein [Marinobacter sp. SS5-14b]|uniref:hypothetical protein n=1 Tax=Marinobacter sp. SS5-14b TaxID=3050456 RepID=UPI0026E06457|nr:hypothetical protein [Marinobacter sp. SS5-14b]